MSGRVTNAGRHERACGACWSLTAASVGDPPYSPLVESLWIAVLGGTAGAALTALATVGLQLFLTWRAERRQDDRERVAMALEFTGRANAMVIWSSFVHVHASKAAEPATLPAIILHQFQPVDLTDMGNTFALHLTKLIRAGGHLVAYEGGLVQAEVDDVVTTTVKIVEGYISPAEARPKHLTWFSPMPPANRLVQSELKAHLAKASQELELLVLGRCATLKGSELTGASSALVEA